jgi:predicted ribosome quality control (RQC) complex YloA/Tae2 family protein
VLVGLDAKCNDMLSLKLARSSDFFLHVAGEPGSHVVVLNPSKAETLDRATLRFAGSLAAAYSKARAGGRVAIHWARCADVSKRRGMSPGKVLLRRHSTCFAEPDRQEQWLRDE